MNEAGAEDAGAKHAGAKDAGAKDAGAKDAGAKDAGSGEAGSVDAVAGNAAVAVCPHCHLFCVEATTSPGRGLPSFAADCPIAAQRESARQSIRGRSGFRLGNDSVTRDAWVAAVRQVVAPEIRVAVNDSMDAIRHFLAIDQSSDRPRWRLVAETTTSLRGYREAVRRDGVIAATLGEAARMSDHVFVVGDVAADFPRWDSGFDPHVRRQSLPSMGANEVANWLSRLHQDELPDARYAAWILGPRSLADSGDGAVVAAEMLLRLIRSWNDRMDDRRAVVVMLDPNRGLDAVARWTQNRGIPSRTHADIRIGSPIAGSQSVVAQIGGVDPGPEWAENYAPASIAGIDRRGIGMRADGTVTVPLPKFAEAQPSTETPWRLLEQITTDAGSSG